MEFQASDVLIITVDAEGAFLGVDDPAVEEMTALRDAVADQGGSSIQVGQHWEDAIGKVSITQAVDASRRRSYLPLVPPRKLEQIFGKTQCDGTTNPGLMPAVTAHAPKLVVVQGRSINECAGTTACSIKRGLREAGIEAPVLLALDSSCFDSNGVLLVYMNRLLETQAEADVPRLIETRKINVSGGKVTVAPARPRRDRAAAPAEHFTR